MKLRSTKEVNFLILFAKKVNLLTLLTMDYHLLILLGLFLRLLAVMYYALERLTQSSDSINADQHKELVLN